MLNKKGRKWLSEDQTSCISWWLFSSKYSDDQIIDYLAYEEEVEIGGVQIRSDYDCTGRWFSHEIDIKRVGSRVLVTQYAALDI